MMKSGQKRPALVLGYWTSYKQEQVRIVVEQPQKREEADYNKVESFRAGECRGYYCLIGLERMLGSKRSYDTDDADTEFDLGFGWEEQQQQCLVDSKSADFVGGVGKIEVDYGFVDDEYKDMVGIGVVVELSYQDDEKKKVPESSQDQRIEMVGDDEPGLQSIGSSQDLTFV